MHRLAVWQLGRVEYADGLRLQKLFGDARARDLVPDSLLLLEHPPVLTLGRGAKRKNIVADGAQLSAQGVEIFETDRGRWSVIPSSACLPIATTCADTCAISKRR